MSPRKSATNVTGDGRWGGVWAKLSSNRLLGEFHSTWSSISTTKPRTRAETAVRRSVGRIPWALSRYEYRSINCAWILPRTLRRDRATPAGRPAAQIGTINDLLMKHGACQHVFAQRRRAVLPVITRSITPEAPTAGPPAWRPDS